MLKKTSRNTPAERVFKHPETQVSDFRLKDFLPISSPSQQTLLWSLTTRVEHSDQQTNLMLPNASSAVRIHSIARPRRSRRRRAVSTSKRPSRAAASFLSLSLSTDDRHPAFFVRFVCVEKLSEFESCVHIQNKYRNMVQNTQNPLPRNCVLINGMALENSGEHLG